MSDTFFFECIEQFHGNFQLRLPSLCASQTQKRHTFEVTLVSILPPFFLTRSSKLLRDMERVPLMTKMSPLNTGPVDVLDFVGVAYDEEALDADDDDDDDLVDEEAADASASSRVCLGFVTRLSSVFPVSPSVAALRVSVRRYSLRFVGIAQCLMASEMKNAVRIGVSLAEAFCIVLDRFATSSGVEMRYVTYTETGI